MILGPMIKRIRTSKGIKQSILADGIMSRSNLSRFEGGKYYPGYDKLILLLDKLEMSLDELLFLHYGYAQPVKRTLHLNLVEAANRYEFDKVQAFSYECRAMYEQTRTEAFYHLYLLGQGFLLQHRREDEIKRLSEIAEQIKPYLLGVDIWHLYEFKLLNNFMFTLDSADAVFFGLRAVKEFDKYHDFAEARTIQQHLMQNISRVCLNERNYEQSLFFLQKALPLADKTNLLYDKIITLVYYEITRLCLKQKLHGSVSSRRTVRRN
ncbi:helix-turn-helix domain-containing protein [Paenibacillus sp. NFR01]|uniref:helix-turn-helix domain-containing protein n=1 Tax=Paenibacillus sp. NFR01 TaxID=1566279 RepID=UPI0008B86885|nr:Rgg/GadR/MutR family transcriptional regulator [Paenibacillus sp. NFR01]SET66039.1 transcriptional activator, Rgg/GadR/MutR family, C-terminal domain-containing protein [Paenibacillus sp. NFR01]